MSYIPTYIVDNPNAKCVVYGATRNIYTYIIPSINSLLINTDIDKVFLLVEDDELPFRLPNKCEIINVSNQTIFPKYYDNWTYMVLLRLIYAKMFPNLKRILSLDVDTIIQEDISSIWEYNIDDYYLSAVPETYIRDVNDPYYNMGCVLFNLEKLRQDNMCEKFIKDYQLHSYSFPEQDIINKLCKKQIYTLPNKFNSGLQSPPPKEMWVVHYACTPRWCWINNSLVQEYANKSLRSINAKKMKER